MPAATKSPTTKKLSPADKIPGFYNKIGDLARQALTHESKANSNVEVLLALCSTDKVALKVAVAAIANELPSLVQENSEAAHHVLSTLIEACSNDKDRLAHVIKVGLEILETLAGADEILPVFTVQNMLKACGGDTQLTEEVLQSCVDLLQKQAATLKPGTAASILTVALQHAEKETTTYRSIVRVGADLLPHALQADSHTILSANVAVADKIVNLLLAAYGASKELTQPFATRLTNGQLVVISPSTKFEGNAALSFAIIDNGGIKLTSREFANITNSSAASRARMTEQDAARILENRQAFVATSSLVLGRHWTSPDVIPDAPTAFRLAALPLQTVDT